jgi:glycosyltransferase involved in cell wall biosynthesis
LVDVIHCITTLERGGAEKQLLILVKEQIKLGFSVTVISLKGKPDLNNELEFAGAKVCTDLLGSSFLVQVQKLKQFLKHNSGVLHAHLPRSELLCFIASSKNKFLVTRHNSEQFFPKAPRIISSSISRYISKKFISCLAISNAVKNHLESNNELRKNVLVRVVYYGYDDSLPTRVLPLNKYRPSLIGTVGRLVSQKDQETLITAFAKYHEKNSKSHLLIIGDGVLRDSLKVFSKNLGISRNITWIKNTSDPHFFMKHMDLFILSSKYEGFGLVLLEAMQSGVPIVAANNSSIPEVLGEKYPGLFKTGDVIDCLDKISCICESFDREELRNIYEFNLARFNPKVMAERVADTYKV